jgi:hypothetical protein
MQDADSLDVRSGKKQEGEFYVWAADEINSILGGCSCTPVCSAYHCLRCCSKVLVSAGHALPGWFKEAYRPVSQPLPAQEHVLAPLQPGLLRARRSPCLACGAPLKRSAWHTPSKGPGRVAAPRMAACPVHLGLVPAGVSRRGEGAGVQRALLCQARRQLRPVGAQRPAPGVCGQELPHRAAGHGGHGQAGR